MASPTLRPLSVGEILDAGIKVFTRHWKVLTICVVGLVGPMNVIQVLLRASIDPNGFDATSAFDTSSNSSANVDAGPAAIGYLVSILLSGLAFLIAFTACFKAVSDAWLRREEPAVGRSLRFGARRLGPVLGAWILWIVGLILAFLALVVPWFYLIVAWSLTLPVLLFEGSGVFAAFGRSRRLVKGRWWPTFGLLLVGYLLVTILGALIQGVLVGLAGVSSDSVVPAAIATVIGSTISNAITTPYLAAVLTILYFDMRVRKEGFEVQLMAEDLDASHDPDAPIPAPLVGDELTPEQKAAAPYWPPPPGWRPPAVSTAAHASWEPPSAEPASRRWPDTADEPDEPVPDAPDEPDEPVPEAADEPDESAPEAADEPDEPAREPPRPDPNRAGWLPPEAPRGPGGL